MQLVSITDVNKCSQLHRVTHSKMKLKYKDLKKGHFDNEGGNDKYNVYNFQRNCFVTKNIFVNCII